MRTGKTGLLLETEKMSSCGTAAMRGRQLPKHTVGRERVCSSIIGKHTRPRDLRARCLYRKGTVHGTTTAGLGSSIKACYKSLRPCNISLRRRLHRSSRAPGFKEQPARGVLANAKKMKVRFVVQSLCAVQGWMIFTGAETPSSARLEQSWLKLRTVKDPNPSRAECIRQGSLGGNVSICNCY